MISIKAENEEEGTLSNKKDVNLWYFNKTFLISKTLDWESFFHVHLVSQMQNNDSILIWVNQASSFQLMYI